MSHLASYRAGDEAGPSAIFNHSPNVTDDNADPDFDIVYRLPQHVTGTITIMALMFLSKTSEVPDRLDTKSDVADDVLDLGHDYPWSTRFMALFLAPSVEYLLNKGISMDRAEFATVSPDNTRRAHACLTFGISLRSCFLHLGNFALLDEAIKLQREALALTPLGDTSLRADACVQLALSLQTRFWHPGDIVPLHETIYLSTRDGRPDGNVMWTRDPSRTNTCGSMAFAFMRRREQTGDTHLLDEAVNLLREALSLRPPGHLKRPSACGVLAATLQSRFEQGGQLSSLEEAVKLLNEQLPVQPIGHPDLPNTLGTMAVILHTLYLWDGNSGLLLQAIMLQRDVLRFIPDDSPERPMAMINLAIALHSLYNLDSRLELVQEAKALFRKAMRSQFAGSHLRRCHHIGMAVIQLDPTTPAYDASEGIKNLAEVDRLPLVLQHGEIRWMASVLVSINAALIPPESLSELLGVYHAVISRLPLLVDAAADDAGARFRSSRVSAQLGSAALACALAAGEIELGLELLEQARAVFWAQAITAQNLGLDNLPEQLRTQITELLNVLDPREVMSTYWLARAVDEHPSHLILQVEKTNLQQLRELLDEVRTVPGFERFMLRPSSAMLMQCATTHPVVVLSVDHNSCHALLLLPGDTEPIPVPLAEVNVGDLERMAVETHGVGWRSRVAADEQERVFNVSRRRKSDGNSSVLAELWRLVVKPIIDAMGLTRESGRARPRLHWVPTGPFTFLPVHAAGIYSGHADKHDCCSNYVVSSYAPTLSALLRARQQLSEATPRTSLTMIAAAAHQSPGMTQLDSVKDEVRTVCSHARDAGIHVVELGAISSAATIADVSAALPDASIVHFACHGVQDALDPLESRLCLGDGGLSVRELMRLRVPHARLAVLSACETAKGDGAQPDQSMHIAATLLFCGFPAVIGTMWFMGDQDGPMVARELYKTLFAHDELTADDIPYALDTAVQVLRAQNVPPARWATFVHHGA